MASYRGVKITIAASGSESGKDDKSSKLENTKETEKKLTKLQKASTISLIHKGVSIIADTAEFALNANLSLTDNYKQQNNLSIAKSIISKASSTITSAITAGVVLGPAGVAVSLALSATSLGVDIAKNYHNQAVAIIQNEAQLDYQRVRAGYSLSGGSTK